MECLQLVLFGFNVIFWAIGGVMLGIGIWVAVDPGAFEALDIANSAGMDDALWSVAIYTFIAIGAFLFVVGLFGCLGAARADRSTFFLWLYAGSVGLVIMAEAVVVILTCVYWNSINENVAKSMYNDVHNHYVNETSQDGISSSWNKMQQEWECCGSFGYQDYIFSKYDNNSDRFVVPYTCCNSKDITEIARCQNGIQEHIYGQGCYFALVDWLNKNAPIIIGITCGFAALQVIGLVFACLLIFGSERKKKNMHG
jgi:hypothetical protein